MQKNKTPFHSSWHFPMLFGKLIVINFGNRIMIMILSWSKCFNYPDRLFTGSDSLADILHSDVTGLSPILPGQLGTLAPLRSAIPSRLSLFKLPGQ
jgi:hypothetical protein